MKVNPIRYIVRIRYPFLQAVHMYGNTAHLIKSTSPYDAWYTDQLWVARKIARKVNGNVCEFNPLNGDLFDIVEIHTN